MHAYITKDDARAAAKATLDFDRDFGLGAHS